MHFSPSPLSFFNNIYHITEIHVSVAENSLRLGEVHHREVCAEQPRPP